MFCVYCGTTNPDDAQICTKCGAALTETAVIEETDQVQNSDCQQPKDVKNGKYVMATIMGVIGLILGVFSLLTSFTVFAVLGISLIFAIGGLALCTISLFITNKAGRKNVVASVGEVLCSIGILISIEVFSSL